MLTLRPQVLQRLAGRRPTGPIGWVWLCECGQCCVKPKNRENSETDQDSTRTCRRRPLTNLRHIRTGSRCDSRRRGRLGGRTCGHGVVPGTDTHCAPNDRDLRLHDIPDQQCTPCKGRIPRHRRRHRHPREDVSVGVSVVECGLNCTSNPTSSDI